MTVPAIPVIGAFLFWRLWPTLVFSVNYFFRRIDSSDLLPVRGRCLTKMLPVQTWHEREQEAEAIEFGDQTRVGGIGEREVRVGNT